MKIYFIIKSQTNEIYSLIVFDAKQAQFASSSFTPAPKTRSNASDWIRRSREMYWISSPMHHCKAVYSSRPVYTSLKVYEKIDDMSQ